MTKTIIMNTQKISDIKIKCTKEKHTQKTDYRINKNADAVTIPVSCEVRDE